MHWLVTLALALAGPAAGQEPQLPALTASWVDAPASGWLSPREPIRIALNRTPTADEGRLALLVGHVDWTGLCERQTDGLVCRPSVVSLPSGERELSVHVVDGTGAWRELSRWPLRVRTAGGFERADVKPAIEVQTKGQPARRRSPAGASSPRDTYHDVGVNGSIAGTFVKNGWTTQVSAGVLGTSYLNERLRYGQLNDEAPVVDLASYLVSAESRRLRFTLGHVMLSPHRHLMADFGARGLSALLRLTPALDVELGATSATSMVGWSVPLGFTDTDHRVVSLTVGVEALPRRPGALRVAASVVDGERRPLSGVTQGAVTDAQRSRGAGLRVVASDAQQRFTLDAGLARTRFDAPEDAELAQGQVLTSIETTTRTARFLDASIGLVHNAKLGATQTASVVVGVHHEQVEPLFRSLAAAAVLADQARDGADLTVTAGPASSRVAYERSRDNLAGLESVLTTRTRKLEATTMVPLGSVGRTETVPWLPTVSYQLVRVQQAGDGLPVNAGFDSLSQVPDQLNTVHTVGVEWTGTHWRGGYRFNQSFQDNRQAGRAAADFLNAANVVSLSLMPSPRADVGVELGFDTAESRETTRRDLTRRAAFMANLRPARDTSISGLVTRTRLFDPAGASASTNTDLSLQVTQAIRFQRRRPDGPRAQAFVRFSRQTLSAFDQLIAQTNDSQVWALNTGLTLRLQ